ncbi:MAG: biopolymer transporter ExbD [Pseudomonadota bacterium]
MQQRFQNLQEEDEQEINITPMLDVVFIMLIFFIVTASFVKEDGIDLNKPDTNQPQNPTEKKNIIVKIDGSDRIFIDFRRVDKRQVRANIERLHAQNPEGIVVIQADKATSNELVVAVMDASRAAGVGNPALAEN